MPLKDLTADVKLSDEEYVKNEKGRFVPFSVNPFRESQAEARDGNSDEEKEGETATEWQELAGDLAWTSTFSSLTSNTTIAEPISLCNYAVFFGLTWHLWVTQTTYDIRYYTNDWWHRALFFCQLGVYATLAACTGSFNVGWEISSDTMHPFTGNVEQSVSNAIITDAVDSMVTSLKGVNIMLFISRILLLAQYLRVLSYRRKSKQMRSWKFYLVPAATFIAGIIFLACFIMMKVTPHSKSVAITQLFLWGLAIGVQVLAAAVTPEDEDGVLKNRGSLSTRLSSLTVIILGEGLNGICSTLRNSLNSLGLRPNMGFQAVSVLLILYFIWLLYFDGFKFSNSSLDEMWLWLHFPLHLSLIMSLEGIKNVFLFNHANNAFDFLFPGFNNCKSFQVTLPPFDKVLGLKITWTRALEDLWASATTSTAQLYRSVATVIDGVYLLYNDEPDPLAQSKLNEYVANNDTVIEQDARDGRPLFCGPNRRYRRQWTYTARWLVAVAGALLIWMAILNVIQHRPKNRFGWGYSLSRIIIGSILILIGGFTSRIPYDDNWVQWILPTVAISYFVVVVIDWTILYLSIQSIQRKEVSPPSQPKADDWSGRSGPSTAVRTFDPDIELDQPHKPAARETSSDPTSRSLLGKDGEGGS